MEFSCFLNPHQQTLHPTSPNLARPRPTSPEPPDLTRPHLLGVAGCGWVWLGVAGCGWAWLGMAVCVCGWAWLGTVFLSDISTLRVTRLSCLPVITDDRGNKTSQELRQSISDQRKLAQYHAEEKLLNNIIKLINVHLTIRIWCYNI
jgi:hypothetical protein